MNPVRFDDHKFTVDQSGGETEIEQMPSQEVEIRQRDLLPIFEPFHRIQPDWNDRYFLHSLHFALSGFYYSRPCFNLESQRSSCKKGFGKKQRYLEV